MSQTNTGTTPDKPTPKTEGKAPDTRSTGKLEDGAKQGKPTLNKMPTSEELAKRKREEKDEGVEAREFTYIGAGEDSPRIINFMGKHRFVRGELTSVSDPDIIAKLIDNPTFVEGEADQELLHLIDEEGREEAEIQRKSDKLLNEDYSKKHRIA